MDDVRFCPGCGRAREGNEHYCAGCGRDLTAPAPLAHTRTGSTQRRPRGCTFLAALGLVVLIAIVALGILGGATAGSGSSSLLGISAPPPPAFRAFPYGPVLVEPRAQVPVELGRLRRGTRVSASVTVAFNRFCLGTPDIDLSAVGPTGSVAVHQQATTGFRFDFTALQDGDYTIYLSNQRATLCARQVRLDFLG